MVMMVMRVVVTVVMVVVVMMMMMVMEMMCWYGLYAISRRQEIKQSHIVDDDVDDAGHCDDDDGCGDDDDVFVCAICHQSAAGDQTES